MFEKVRVILALLCTLSVIYLVPQSLTVLIILLLLWALALSPWQMGEIFSFIIAGIFFVIQNYVCLKAGVFEFKLKDFLLMPYYEPFLWGFYFIGLKRFVTGRAKRVAFAWSSTVGLLATAIAFSAFSHSSSQLLIASTCSTLLLFVLFHRKLDFYYAAAALVLGFIIEMFGVSTGLWWYPAPDFLGIPYWFATMWISVGLLGGRFLIPLGEWLASRVAPQGA